MYESKKSEMYDMADVPTYEEVAPYRRQGGAKHRLVVLVGEYEPNHLKKWSNNATDVTIWCHCLPRALSLLDLAL